MAYMSIVGPCVNCGVIISANPDKVPSLRIDGEKEALCESCFHKWNKLHRTSKGLEPIKLEPDAYEGLECH